jgi:aminoglycoside phosphotransferase
MASSSPTGWRALRVAGEVLARHGADVSEAVPGHGYTNAVWLTETLAVRVAREPGAEDLLREARLAAVLPAEIGYPPIIDAGVTDGVAWVLAERTPGQNLAIVWGTLDWPARKVAITDMWSRAEVLHRLDPSRIAPLLRPDSPFYAATAEQARASLQRLTAARVLTETQTATLLAQLDEFWPAVSTSPRVVNHGDLSPINALWDGQHVTALVDLEFAVLASIHVDLGELVKLAFGPPDPRDPYSEHRSPGRRDAEDAVCAIASTATSGASARALLTGHSILLEAVLVELMLPAGRRALQQSQAYQLLTALARGDGGYLAPVLNALQ